jgi:hypothetical protein
MGRHVPPSRVPSRTVRSSGVEAWREMLGGHQGPV